MLSFVVVIDRHNFPLTVTVIHSLPCQRLPVLRKHHDVSANKLLRRICVMPSENNLMAGDMPFVFEGSALPTAHVFDFCSNSST